jgi:hypothetical protein
MIRVFSKTNGQRSVDKLKSRRQKLNISTRNHSQAENFGISNTKQRRGEGRKRLESKHRSQAEMFACLEVGLHERATDSSMRDWVSNSSQGPLDLEKPSLTWACTAGGLLISVEVHWPTGKGQMFTWIDETEANIVRRPLSGSTLNFSLRIRVRSSEQNINHQSQPHAHVQHSRAASRFHASIRLTWELCLTL